MSCIRQIPERGRGAYVSKEGWSDCLKALGGIVGTWAACDGRVLDWNDKVVKHSREFQRAQLKASTVGDSVATRCC